MNELDLAYREAHDANRIVQFYSNVKGGWMMPEVEVKPCWEWMGSTNQAGYGLFSLGFFHGVKRGTVIAHRFMYEMIHGSVPEGKVVDHLCHNRRCVNPNHLRAILQSENVTSRAGAQANSTTGYRGVSPFKGKYRARVNHQGKSYYCGTFNTPEEAAEAARQKRRELFIFNPAD